MSISKEQLEYLKAAHPLSKKELDSKQILLEKLKMYRNVLTSEKLEYLESLIELEISAIGNTLSRQNQLALLDLGLYRDIVKYNIAHRTKELLESLDIPGMELDLDSSGNVSTTLHFNKTRERYKVYFYHSKIETEGEFQSPEEMETKDIRLGHIYLYRFLIDDSIRAKEARLLRQKLAEEKAFLKQYKQGEIKIRAYEEITDASRNITQLERRLQKIQKPVTDRTKYISDVIEQVHNMILKDYGLTNDSFEEPHYQGLHQVYAKLYNGDDSTCLHKTLVKRMPGLLLTDQIEYR